MGLQEKQAWVYVKEKLQSDSKEISEATGSSVEIKFVEDSFGTKELIERIPEAVLGFLVEAIKELCKDDLAKGALKSTLKTVEITNASVENFELNLAKNKLTVKANFDSNGTCGIQFPHSNDYVAYLTKSL